MDISELPKNFGITRIQNLSHVNYKTQFAGLIKTVSGIEVRIPLDNSLVV